ncbi:hypothetical protein GCE86_18415 [Micromonospora terminaliae]|uniref:Uncharacterized protein n=1 Tax=Micromonospora terminaliae TaxID=1914461 RepID=A0AAJ2ZHU1_9ACTN|nr:hypothetical protein [Micromonospora terminaliae]NES29189.1 hypothetical protein [Micromonospora terminaliae]QGL48816.1 hypothetical protein GCE86_18415 [Micromonospora terminaliae]
MTEETLIALLNYDWLVRNRGLDAVALDWDSNTLVHGDGGTTMETLCDPGFTPATSGDWAQRSADAAQESTPWAAPGGPSGYSA